MQYIKERLDEKLTISLLLRIHERVTVGDMDANPGKIRRGLRAVKSKRKVIYTAPPPEQLAVILREFIEWFNNCQRA